jgi:hypothetical protein
MDVRLPNGKIIANVPEGTSKTEIMRKAVNSGLATYADFGETIDPAEGKSDWYKARAGAGKAFVDLVRGVAQALTPDDSESGQAVQAGIDDAKRRDAALLESGAGSAGNLIGNIGLGVATAAVPGANTVLGSAALGGLMGGLQPTATGESTAQNVLSGVALGGAGQAIGNAVPRVASSLLAPFSSGQPATGGVLRRAASSLGTTLTGGGRERIVAETLRRFARDPDAIANASGASRIPGVQMTLAEATQDPGLAALQNAARSLDPMIGGEVAERNMANTLAVRDAVGRIAGDDAAMDTATQARKAFGDTAYDAPKKAMVEANDELRDLLERPSMKEAWARARRLAAEAGESLVDGKDIPAQTVPTGLVNEFGRAITRDAPEEVAKYSGKGLHYLKMAMDALLKDPTSGIAGAEAGAIGGTRDQLVRWLGQNVPGYDAARQGYAAASRPINQMEVGRAIYDTLVPALADAPGVALDRSRAQQFAQALRAGDQLAKKATEFDGATLANVLDPPQMQTLNDVQEFLARRAMVEGARPPGSNTAQNLASQNIMRQIIGPLGLPQSWAESVASQTLGRGLGVLARPAEEAVQQRLVEALMNPQTAAQMMQRLQPSQQAQLAQSLYRYALPATAVGSGAYAAGQ